MIASGATYIGAFVVAIAVLVVIHEFGHYSVARFFGVKVLRFSFGFGRVLWSRRIGNDQTEWTVCAIPLGGYVKMLDESEGQVCATEVHRAFNRQSLGCRASIVIAGPLANLLLAIVLYAVVFMHGTYEFRPIVAEPVAGSPAALAGIRAGSEVIEVNGKPVASWQELRWILLEDLLETEQVRMSLRLADGAIERRELRAPAGLGNAPERDALAQLGLRLPSLPLAPTVGAVVKGSPAQDAGIAVGDRLLAIDGIVVTEWDEFASRVRRSPGVPLLLDVRRKDETLRFEVVPAPIALDGHIVGRLGIGPQMPAIEDDPRAALVQLGPITALAKASVQTWQTSVLTLRMIGRMIVGEMSWKNVSGPVTMADYAGQSAQYGLSAYLRFLALISISLGVLNLLPIPILDGGHLLYYLAEALTGKPLPESVVNLGQRIGMALLAVLMFFAFYNDINRLVSG